MAPDTTTAGGEPAPPSGPNKHTAIGIGLNTLLLAMIGYGYWQSDQWRWAWALVAVPIAIVTARYILHWLGGDK